MSEFLLLFVAAFFAGLVDAMGGGGGLIQVPALFSALPGTAPATLFGTNKLASIWGTGAAAINLGRRIRIEWNAVLPAAVAALLGAFGGAYAVTHLPADWVRKALPFVLIGVVAYTWRAKQFGLHHAPLHRGGRERLWALLVGSAIGFYDGFFGPGTGSFLIFLFVRWFGFDFLGASAASKIVNVACNLAALTWFGLSGHVLLQLGAAMAVCNVAGALLGSQLVIRYGSRLIRQVFMVMVCLLILKTGYDAYFSPVS